MNARQSIWSLVDNFARGVLGIQSMPAQSGRGDRAVGSDDCEQLRTTKPKPVTSIEHEERWDLERTYGGEGGE